MRSNERKRLHNRSILSRLRNLERDYRELLTAGKKDEAAKAYPGVASALDKATKSGAVHPTTACRKKSRLALGLNRVK